MPILDGVEETVKEACGEIAGRFLEPHRQELHKQALTAIAYSYCFICRDLSHFAVFQQVEDALHRPIFLQPRLHQVFTHFFPGLGAPQIRERSHIP